jgi:hypothetical protein
MGELWESLSPLAQAAVIGILAGAIAKGWDFAVWLKKARISDDEREEQTAINERAEHRRDMLDRIASLETDNRALQRHVTQLEGDVARLIGIVSVFRICPQPDCPTLSALRINNDLAWLDTRIRQRGNGGATAGGGGTV